MFGEMAIIEKEVRSASVVAISEVRLLSMDKKGFLRPFHGDLSPAYRILQRVSRRIQDLTNQVAQRRAGRQRLM